MRKIKFVSIRLNDTPHKESDTKTNNNNYDRLVWMRLCIMYRVRRWYLLYNFQSSRRKERKAEIKKYKIEPDDRGKK